MISIMVLGSLLLLTETTIISGTFKLMDVAAPPSSASWLRGILLRAAQTNTEASRRFSEKLFTKP